MFNLLNWLELLHFNIENMSSQHTQKIIVLLHKLSRTPMPFDVWWRRSQMSQLVTCKTLFFIVDVGAQGGEWHHRAHHGIIRSGRMSWLLSLLEVLLRLPGGMGGQSNQFAGGVSRRRHSHAVAEQNHLLSECVHVVVQLCVVDDGPVAPPYWLDCDAWNHSDFRQVIPLLVQELWSELLPLQLRSKKIFGLNSITALEFTEKKSMTTSLDPRSSPGIEW